MKLHMKLQMSIKNCRSRHSIYTPTCSHLQPCPRRIYPEKNDPFRSQESPCAPQRIICDISMKMICDAHTCGDCRYLERDEQDDRTANLAEFLANCQHAKCKVVRLVRQQISKLQNMQVRVPAFPVIGPIDPPNTFPTSLKLPSGSFGELSLSLSILRYIPGTYVYGRAMLTLLLYAIIRSVSAICDATFGKVEAHRRKLNIYLLRN